MYVHILLTLAGVESSQVRSTIKCHVTCAKKIICPKCETEASNSNLKRAIGQFLLSVHCVPYSVLDRGSIAALIHYSFQILNKTGLGAPATMAIAFEI